VNWAASHGRCARPFRAGRGRRQRPRQLRNDASDADNGALIKRPREKWFGVRNFECKAMQAEKTMRSFQLLASIFVGESGVAHENGGHIHYAHPLKTNILSLLISRKT
jgi:hypothetical protein